MEIAEDSDCAEERGGGGGGGGIEAEEELVFVAIKGEEAGRGRLRLGDQELEGVCSHVYGRE